MYNERRWENSRDPGAVRDLSHLQISKVPNTLHTPLMSGTNAIHGIVVLGALVVFGEIEHPSLVLQVILLSRWCSAR